MKEKAYLPGMPSYSWQSWQLTTINIYTKIERGKQDEETSG